MIRTILIEGARLVATAACIGATIAVASIACDANAANNPHMWPQYAETESLQSVAPMGVWISDGALLTQLINAPNDSNCEAFDARFGDGAAARVLSR